MVIDPVCGMRVNENSAAATYQYKDKTYYFCSRGCQAAFAKEPEKYLKGTEANQMHSDHRHDL
jgi:YHS domain-containing protein